MSRGMLYTSYPRSIIRDSISDYSDPKLQTLKEPSIGFGVQGFQPGMWGSGLKV